MQLIGSCYAAHGNLIDVYEPEVRTHITYDSAGSLILQVDKGTGNDLRSTQYSWANSVALQSRTDVQNNLTTTFTYRPDGRQDSITESGMSEGNLRKTLMEYDDASRKVTVTSDLREFGDGKLQTMTTYDTLGRVALVQKSDGVQLSGGNGIKVATYYHYPPDPPQSPLPTSGHWVVTSSPYRDPSDSTLEWTCTQYDELNRVAAVSMFNGATPPDYCGRESNRTGMTPTAYDAEWTTVTDPAGKVRAQQRDGLGRLIKVVEDPWGLNYQTNYTYDPLDNLTVVAQGIQTRQFTYSSLGRLLHATNPENGTISYEYNDSGDLALRTDALGKTSAMTYDSLHRVLTKTYGDGTPTVNYLYHLVGTSPGPNIGRLKSVTADGVGGTEYTYGPLGKVLTSTQTINSAEGNLIYGFNYDWYLNGGLKWEHYPSGREVYNSVDDACPCGKRA